MNKLETFLRFWDRANAGIQPDTGIALTKEQKTEILETTRACVLHQRIVHIAGTEIYIHGRPNDPYFDGLKGTCGANDFLINSLSGLPSTPTIFDVGANIGVTTSIFKTLIPDSRVICLEPDPEAYPLLLKTIEANNFNNVHAHQKALGAVNGTLSFTHNQTSASASHLAPTDSMMVGHTPVDVVRLDDFADGEAERIDFIKIDVEGFEIDVLEGGRKKIAQHQPPVFLEFNSFALIAFRNINPRTMLECLFDTFPHVYTYSNGQPVEIKTEDDRLTFIHENIVRRGGVDDLFCTWSSRT